MSKKRRTKKQKLRAKKRRQTQVVKDTGKLQKNPVKLKTAINQTKDKKKATKSKSAGFKKSSIEEVALFRYDKKLIYKDLLKSALVTLFIFGLLVGIYFWLK